MTQINQLRSQTIINRSKKTTIILALLVTVFSSFTFANGKTNKVGTPNIMTIADGSYDSNSTSVVNATDNIAMPVKASFKQSFKGAQLINSEVHGKYTKLTFKMNQAVLSAYYTENGRLVAVVRNILSTQLPINLMLDLKKNYSEYWITELFELNADGQSSYYVSMENVDTKLVLHSTGDNTWEIYQQTDKN